MIGALLGRVPVLVWAVAGALAWGAWQRHLAVTAQRALLEQQAGIHAATIQGMQRQIDEQERILKEQQHAGEQATKARDAAEVARLDALDAAGRLQQRARDLAARACPGAAAAAGVSASGPAAGAGAGPDLFPDVLRRLEAAGGLAAAAYDRARIAGVECEQRYDALRRRAGEVAP